METIKKEKVITGSTELFKIDKNDCKIKADIVIDQNNTVEITGFIKDCANLPIEGTLVKLIKIEGLFCKVIDTTFSNCDGFYKFKICDVDLDACYKVIAEKTICCFEKILETNFDDCKECHKHNDKDKCEKCIEKDECKKECDEEHEKDECKKHHDKEHDKDQCKKHDDYNGDEEHCKKKECEYEVQKKVCNCRRCQLRRLGL